MVDVREVESRQRRGGGILAPLARIDLSYFDERTVGLAKILVSSLDGVEAVLDLPVDEVSPTAGYEFGYLGPNRWIASIISFNSDPALADLVRFRSQGDDFVEFTPPDISTSSLFRAGIYSFRRTTGAPILEQSIIYNRDGDQILGPRIPF